MRSKGAETAAVVAVVAEVVVSVVSDAAGDARALCQWEPAISNRKALAPHNKADKAATKGVVVAQPSRRAASAHPCR